MPTEEKASIVKIWFEEVFSKGDPNAVDRLSAEDILIHSQGHDEGFAGTENFKNWLSWYCESFVDRTWSVHDMIEEGDKIVARYTGYSTYKGGLLEIPPKDQKIKETGIIIFLIEKGKITEQWCEMSDLQVVQQLGVKFV
ncbi:ester cyclase [Virgibacillus sp. JSM 102003]|uniref:ester cyclase n=1 Tax=Virgibacillus sp. JSM 102003 TaxID=1562108 RepID=UPI0035C02827